MSRHLHRPGGAPGMTLIEILVAISISALIMGVALSVYVTVLGSLRRQNDARWDSAASTLDALRHDLVSCVPASFSNAPAFQVDQTSVDQTSVDQTLDDDRALSTLSFCTGDLKEGEEDFARLEIRRNRYSVQPGSPATNQALVRETVTLWGAEALGTPSSNELMNAVSRFEVNVLDGDTWTNQWQSKPNHLLPRAARVRLEWATGHTTETASIVVYIPAGNSVRAESAHAQPK